MNWRHFFVFLSAVLIYGNTINHGFVLDNGLSIAPNPAVNAGIERIPKLLFPSSDQQKHTYNPLTEISFAIEYHFWKLNPKGYHLVSILLFGVLCLVLYILLMKMDWLHPDLSFLLILLFISHPIHSEVVSNVHYRDELYCFLFFAIAMLDYIQYLSNKKLYFLIAPLFLMMFSMLAKETGFMLLPFFFFLAWSKTSSWKKAIRSSFWIIIPLIVYWGLYFSFTDLSEINEHSLLENSLRSAQSISQLWATKFGLWGKFVAILLIPYPLVYDYSYSTIRMMGWLSSLVLLFVMFLVATKSFLLYSYNKDRNLALKVYFAGSLFLLPILLRSNLLFLTETLFAERFLLIPSFGFFLLLFLAIQTFFWKPSGMSSKVILSGLAAICLLFAAITWNRNADWKSNETLFTADIKHLKTNAKANWNLAEIYAAKGDSSEIEGERRAFYETAIRLLEDAIEIVPSSDFFKESGRLYEATNRTDGAIKAYETYLELNPLDAEIEARLNALKPDISVSE